MKKFLVILLCLIIFSSFSISTLAAGPGGQDPTDIDPFPQGILWLRVDEDFWSRFSSFTVYTFNFISSVNDKFNTIVIDPASRFIGYQYINGNTLVSNVPVYANGAFLKESYQVMYVYENYLDVLHNTELPLIYYGYPTPRRYYGEIILVDFYDLYMETFSSHPYSFMYHNPDSDVTYVYFSSSPIYYNVDESSYAYMYGANVISYELTLTNHRYIDTINQQQNQIITADTSSLIWSNFNIYDSSDSPYVHFRGHTAFSGNYEDTSGGISRPGEEDDSNENWFTRFLNSLKSIWQVLTDLPTILMNGIRTVLSEIFVPDDNYINSTFGSFTNELKSKFNLDTSVFESLFQSEQPVEDVYVDYSISGVGDFNLKVFDASFFKQGVEYFRPIIRGFLILLLFFYNIKQLIGFFGYDAGVIAGRQDMISESKDFQRKGD